jgi:signal transduction histidine kinase
MATWLRDERERLRALTSRLETIREEERTTVAREIHDELGQALTGLRLDLAQLSKKLPKNERALTARVKSLGELVEDIIKVVRRISTQLRPGILDELGLTAAMDWQVEDFGNRMEIESEFLSTFDDTDLDRDLSTALFRILQEALTNIARHAHATRIKINIREEAGFVIMEVEDDGRGITEHEVHDSKSLGLIGIRERALILGGEAQISGRKGKGTSLVVRIPITGAENKHA